jgi:hypothetical protein
MGAENAIPIGTNFCVRVTPTTVDIIRNGTEIEQYTHGLTISNNLAIRIDNKKTIVISSGKSYTVEAPFVLTTLSHPMIDIWGGADNLSLSIGCKDYSNPVWMFGDSYFTPDTCRWIYYLHQDGYGDNCLVDAYAGERSEYAIQSFKTSIIYGTPKYAVWCLGMNDGDVGGVVNPMWMDAMNEFLFMCESNNIVPILATIPNTPTVDNRYKNAWVKSSGYRYIDFAQSVQDEDNNTWYDGLLYSDNVHPTVEGAITLYNRFLCDFPEVTNKY